MPCPALFGATNLIIFICTSVEMLYLSQDLFNSHNIGYWIPKKAEIMVRLLWSSKFTSDIDLIELITLKKY